jgi:S-DNA-T family DNA segregation ATPase FtsK/SpoIIIE
LRFQEREASPWPSRLAWGLAAMLVLSSLLSLHGPQAKLYQSQIALGGAIGSIVVQGLVAVFNPLGVGLLLWSLVAVLVIFYSERSLSDLAAAAVGVGRILRRALGAWMSYAGQIFTWPEPATESAGDSGTSRLQIFGPNAKETKSAGILERLLERRGLAKESQEDEAALPRAAGPLSLKENSETQQDDAEPDLARDDEADTSLNPAAGGTPAEAASNRRRAVRLKAKVERRIENWQLPAISVLEDPPASRVRVDRREIEEKAKVIVDKLSMFGIKGEVTGAKAGPAVTLFEYRPNADVELSKITGKADDLALALSAESLRIIAPIPGRDVVGIETSNQHRETVYLKDIIADEKFWSKDLSLPLCMGREVDGTPRIVDLRTMPHMMVAGQTGSGKSVFTVSCISGLLFRHSPKTLRLVLVDPKQVDLTLFTDIPHLLMPPLTEARKAVAALNWAVREMEKRNRSFNRFGARKLEEFNEKVEKLSREEIENHAQINADLEIQNKRNEQYYFQSIPYVLFVIEEFGDLMTVDKDRVEKGVVRLAQMARAAGIHLILAMQTPRKEVVTGLIKTNIPGRVSFKVPSLLDSKIILDERGAERLLGKGDLLFLAPGVSKPQRHHAPWLTNDEIEKLVKHWRDQGQPAFDELAMRALEGGEESQGGAYAGNGGGGFGEGEGEDEMYDQILAWVASQKTVSTSALQRRFNLGYPRASRLIDTFEREGVVGPANGSKPRQVLVQPMPSP